MSAQRRTTVKDKPTSGSADAVVPAARPKEKPAKEGGSGKGKAAAATGGQSVVAQRYQSLRDLFRDSMSEMKKVNWPDQQTTRNLTFLVIGLSLVLGLVLGGIDYVLQRVFAALS